MWFSAPLPAPLMLVSMAIGFGAGIAIFVLEVLASVSLLRSAARDIDWRWLSRLVAGNVLCLPLASCGSPGCPRRRCGC